MAPKGPPYSIPDGFPDVLQRFVVHVLKSQPDNLIDCAAKYFASMQSDMGNHLQSMKSGRSKVMSYLEVSKSNNNNPGDTTATSSSIQQMSQSLIAASQQLLAQDMPKSASKPVPSPSGESFITIPIIS